MGRFLDGVTPLFADPLVLYKTAPTGATSAVALSGAGATSYSFVCTGRSPTSSTYRYTVDSTSFIELFIGRMTGKRNRWTVRFNYSVLVPTVVDVTINEVRVSTVYIVVDYPIIGTGGAATMQGIFHMLSTWLYDSTDAAILVDRLVNGET